MFSVHNSLTGKVEAFKPIFPGEAKMYHCGPTVYDYVHIGNLRSFVLADLLRRTLAYENYKVTQVMNITDIGHLQGDGDSGEDKMTGALKREGKPLTMEAMRELAAFYTARFKEDLAKLNILEPHELPNASDHIAEDIELINALEDKGFTYKTSDGIYFDTSKDEHYGKLGGIGGETQSRIGENSEKRNSRDFALWKFNDSLGYPSPWGQGFPGWHVECSAMSQKYLGKEFDFHTGGIDLKPVHHNNEIAQSTNACGCEFAHYWLHNEFVILGSDKMAKSEGNIIRLKDIEEKGFSPLAYRYFLLQSHYRTPTNFSWEALESAQNAYRKLKEFAATLPQGGEVDEVYRKEFVEALDYDLGTPEALAIVWKLMKDEAVPLQDKRATLLDFDSVLGFKLEENEFELKEIPDEIKNIVENREIARSKGDWLEADRLRNVSGEAGYGIDDTSSGPRIYKL